MNNFPFPSLGPEQLLLQPELWVSKPAPSHSAQLRLSLCLDHTHPLARLLSQCCSGAPVASPHTQSRFWALAIIGEPCLARICRPFEDLYICQGAENKPFYLCLHIGGTPVLGPCSRTIRSATHCFTLRQGMPIYTNTIRCKTICSTTNYSTTNRVIPNCSTQSRCRTICNRAIRAILTCSTTICDSTARIISNQGIVEVQGCN